jgi:hypothetical protein
MLYDIAVGNKKHARKPGYTPIYVGRKPAGQSSPLGNPFSAKSHGQGQKVGSVLESIELCRADFRKRIDRGDEDIIQALKEVWDAATQGPVELICWCAPGPCHAEIIRDLMLNREKRILEKRAKGE